VLAITVFDGVVMQIIGVTIKIGFVTDLMFPKTALPERRFPMFAFGRVQPIGAAVMFPTLNVGLAFNQTPAARKIGIAFV
jgi:cbb3-type cytochrome oxidase subunit 1